MDAQDYYLPKIFPTDLLKRAIKLDDLGFKGLAWKFEDCIEVINFFKQNGIIILGGHILTNHNGIPKYNYDNWHYNADDRLSDMENSKISCEIAESYINGYRVNEEVLFEFGVKP